MTDRDHVRLLIGDTDAGDPQLTDTEIDGFIATRQIETAGGDVANIYAAAADASASLAAKYARHFNFAEDDQRFERAQRVNHYLVLEDSLRRRQGGTFVG